MVLITGKDPQKNMNGFLNSLTLLSSNTLKKIGFINIIGMNKDEIDFDVKKINLQITFKGYLKHSFVKKELMSSKYFVLPSYYESFGIPGLEALSFGCKVAASNTGALREILENHAIYFNPYSIKSIASSIKKLVSNENFIQKNLNKKISEYSWVNCSKSLNNFLCQI